MRKKRLAVVMVVISQPGDGEVQALTEALELQLGGRGQVLTYADLSDAAYVSYAAFREFCIAAAATRGRGHAAAARSWTALLQEVPEVLARCVKCTQARGVCRCPEVGFEGVRSWVYFTHYYGWEVNRAALLALTSEHWARLHPNTAQRLQAFAESLRS